MFAAAARPKALLHRPAFQAVSAGCVSLLLVACCCLLQLAVHVQVLCIMLLAGATCVLASALTCIERRSTTTEVMTVESTQPILRGKSSFNKSPSGAEQQSQEPEQLALAKQVRAARAQQQQHPQQQQPEEGSCMSALPSHAASSGTDSSSASCATRQRDLQPLQQQQQQHRTLPAVAATSSLLPGSVLDGRISVAVPGSPVGSSEHSSRKQRVGTTEVDAPWASSAASGPFGSSGLVGGGGLTASALAGSANALDTVSTVSSDACTMLLASDCTTSTTMTLGSVSQMSPFASDGSTCDMSVRGGGASVVGISSGGGNTACYGGDAAAFLNTVKAVARLGGARARYVPRCRVAQVRMKIPFAEPEALPSGGAFLESLSKALAGAACTPQCGSDGSNGGGGNGVEPVQWDIVGAAVRRGCIELMLEFRTLEPVPELDDDLYAWGSGYYLPQGDSQRLLNQQHEQSGSRAIMDGGAGSPRGARGNSGRSLLQAGLPAAVMDALVLTQHQPPAAVAGGDGGSGKRGTALVPPPNAQVLMQSENEAVMLAWDVQEKRWRQESAAAVRLPGITPSSVRVRAASGSSSDTHTLRQPALLAAPLAAVLPAPGRPLALTVAVANWSGAGEWMSYLEESLPGLTGMSTSRAACPYHSGGFHRDPTTPFFVATANGRSVPVAVRGVRPAQAPALRHHQRRARQLQSGRPSPGGASYATAIGGSLGADDGPDAVVEVDLEVDVWELAAGGAGFARSSGSGASSGSSGIEQDLVMKLVLQYGALVCTTRPVAVLRDAAVVSELASMGPLPLTNCQGSTTAADNSAMPDATSGTPLTQTEQAGTLASTSAPAAAPAVVVASTSSVGSDDDGSGGGGDDGVVDDWQAAALEAEDLASALDLLVDLGHWLAFVAVLRNQQHQQGQQAAAANTAAPGGTSMGSSRGEKVAATDLSRGVTALLAAERWRSPLTDVGCGLLDFAVERGMVSVSERLLHELTTVAGVPFDALALPLPPGMALAASLAAAAAAAASDSEVAGTPGAFASSSSVAGGVNSGLVGRPSGAEHLAVMAVAADADGSMTLLHRAVRSCSLPMVQAVLRWGQVHGCELSWAAPGPEGLAPLHMMAAAAASGVPSAMEMAQWMLRSCGEAAAQWGCVRDVMGSTPAGIADALGAQSLSALAAATTRAAAAAAAGARRQQPLPWPAATGDDAGNSQLPLPLQQRSGGGSGPLAPVRRAAMRPARRVARALGGALSMSMRGFGSSEVERQYVDYVTHASVLPTKIWLAIMVLAHLSAAYKSIDTGEALQAFIGGTGYILVLGLFLFAWPTYVRYREGLMAVCLLGRSACRLSIALGLVTMAPSVQKYVLTHLDVLLDGLLEGTFEPMRLPLVTLLRCLDLPINGAMYLRWGYHTTLLGAVARSALPSVLGWMMSFVMDYRNRRAFSELLAGRRRNKAGKAQ